MRKASLNDEVTAVDVAETAHSLAENIHIRVRRGGRRQIANTRRLYGLLGACRERPGARRDGQTADEISTIEWTAQHVSLHVAGRRHHHRITKAGASPWIILKCSESGRRPPSAARG